MLSIIHKSVAGGTTDAARALTDRIDKADLCILLAQGRTVSHGPTTCHTSRTWIELTWAPHNAHSMEGLNASLAVVQAVLDERPPSAHGRMDPLSRYARLGELTARLLERWPAHAGYVAKSFEGREADILAVSEDLAQIILTLGAVMEHGVSGLIDDYRYLCESLMLPEELYFRRHGAYRLSKFADAERECYADPVLMGRYMNGVLLSSVFWENHTRAFAAYLGNYLPRLPAGAAHLEIGPGHGLLLLLAARREGISRLEGWDVSPTSVAHTQAMLATLGVERPVALTRMNLFEAPAATSQEGFDSIVMSEILEHLEDPVAALRAASRQLKPGGLFWVNVPANSPAPDHIFLVGGLDHAIDMVGEAGLDVVDSMAVPMSGVSLEKAIRRKLTVSCLIVARKPSSAA